MKTSELMLKMAEAMSKYGDVPVRLYDSAYGSDDGPVWQVADIREVRMDGMEVEVWV